MLPARLQWLEPVGGGAEIGNPLMLSGKWSLTPLSSFLKIANKRFIELGTFLNSFFQPALPAIGFSTRILLFG
jgi:hypothetical protein